MDSETGLTFGRLAADLDTVGRPSTHRIQDLWLAALAVQHGLAVLTQNPRDFEGIPGLKVMRISSTDRQ
jgi:predicted nucleic acid-binding protein